MVCLKVFVKVLCFFKGFQTFPKKCQNIFLNPMFKISFNSITVPLVGTSDPMRVLLLARAKVKFRSRTKSRALNRLSLCQ